MELPPCRIDQWNCLDPLPAAIAAIVRRRLVLDHFKWDPQVGDTPTPAFFPLVLPPATVGELQTLAETLAAEALAAEEELLWCPELLRRLGLPRAVFRILADSSRQPTPAAARVVRFDFHPTTSGWCISEANSDVPGGYAESSHLARLVAEHYPGTRPCGDPVEALVIAIGNPGCIALLAAPGYMEDQQVIACLAEAFRKRGWQTLLGHAGQVAWSRGCARLVVPTGAAPLDAIFRFFQGEWLPYLPERCRWGHFFRGGTTPVCNPGTSLVTESKRFPLVWDDLAVPLAAWRALMPLTLDPRQVPWQRDARWLLKGAFSNNGDEVIDRAACTRGQWWRVVCSAHLWPGQWAAQRRFAALPVQTPMGMMYPCLGVYVINGRAAGIYGRLSFRPLIDYSAIDVAVLTTV